MDRAVHTNKQLLQLLKASFPFPGKSPKEVFVGGHSCQSRGLWADGVLPPGIPQLEAAWQGPLCSLPPLLLQASLTPSAPFRVSGRQEVCEE